MMGERSKKQEKRGGRREGSGAPAKPLYEVSEVEVDDRYGIGIFLRNLRLGRGVTVEQLAEGCGLGKNTIVNVEKGKFSPRADVVMSILQALDGKMVLKADGDV